MMRWDLCLPEHVTTLVEHITEAHEALRQLQTDARQKKQEEPNCSCQEI